MEALTVKWPKKEYAFQFPVVGDIDFELIIKRSKVFKVYNDLLWKWNFIRDMRQIKDSFTLRSMIMDLIRKDEKLNNLEFWRSFPKKMAEMQFGIRFPESVPSSELKEVIMDGMYFNFKDFLPTKHDTVLDVGAQFGDYSLMCSLVFGAKRVIAFEPLPGVYSLFKEAVDLNGANNIIPNNYAVGSNNGHMKIHADGLMGNKYGKKEFLLNSVTLDSIIGEKIDLLKIDVEGFELEVLNGAVNVLDAYHPRIIIETHSSKLKREALSILSRYGYTVIHKGKTTFSWLPGMDVVQNLYLN